MPIRRQALAQSISPDGLLIAFTISRETGWQYQYAFTPQPEIWVMGPRGDNARKIIAGDDSTRLGPVRWSPDGTRLAYLAMRSLHGMSVAFTIESCDLHGATRSAVLPGLRQAFPPGIFSTLNVTDFAWLPNNRVVYPTRENMPRSRDSRLWQIDVDRSTFRAVATCAHAFGNAVGFGSDAGLGDLRSGGRFGCVAPPMPRGHSAGCR